MTIKSDIEIAQEAKPLPITDIADACGMDGAYIEQYGRYKAKIDNRFLKETNRPDGKLVLVTAITPCWRRCWTTTSSRVTPWGSTSSGLRGGGVWI